MFASYIDIEMPDRSKGLSSTRKTRVERLEIFLTEDGDVHPAAIPLPVSRDSKARYKSLYVRDYSAAIEQTDHSCA